MKIIVENINVYVLNGRGQKNPQKLTINLNSYILFQSVTLNHSDCIFLWSLIELFQILTHQSCGTAFINFQLYNFSSTSSRFGLLLFYGVLYSWFSIKQKYLFIFILTLIISKISWGKFRNELLITAVKKGLKYFNLSFVSDFS